MRRGTRILAALLATATAALLSAAAAGASFHLVKIREVHNGGDAAHSYVMLQLPAAGEGFLMGHYVSFRSADGQIQGDHLINFNAANQDSQRTFLVGGSAVAGSDDVGATDQLVGSSGAACYESGAGGLGGLDCVSWGSFTGSLTPLSSPAGSPAPAIAPGQSLIRNISANCPTTLDVADDTDDSAADFSIGAPIGRDNAAAPTEKPCTPVKKRRKCRKKHKKTGAYSAKKHQKKCKKHKKRHR